MPTAQHNLHVPLLSLSQNFFQCPVTAIAVTLPPRCLVLAGEGTSLKVYDLSQRRLLCVVRRLLDVQPVHGITVAESPAGHQNNDLINDSTTEYRVLVWGGNSVRLLSFQLSTKCGDLVNGLNLDGALPAPYAEARLSEAPLVFTPQYGPGILGKNIVSVGDWIVDVCFAPEAHQRSGETLAFVLTAHNRLHIITYAPNGQVSSKEVSRGRHTTLFCGSLRFRTSDEILVVIGTVSGHIEIWKSRVVFEGRGSPFIDRNSSVSIRAHNGSIFGVSLSTVTTTCDSTPRWIVASCSDDRTARLWELGELEDLMHVAARRAAPVEQTGFVGWTDNTSIVSSQHGEDFLNAKENNVSGQWSLANADLHGLPKAQHLPQVSKAIGHQSRVWKVLIKEPSYNTAHLFSVGEDCAVHLWEAHTFLKEAHPVVTEIPLIPKQSFQRHVGRNIWASALRTMSEQVMYLITGGADGALAYQQIIVEKNADQKLANASSQRRTDHNISHMNIADTIHPGTNVKSATHVHNRSTLGLHGSATLLSYALLGGDQIIGTSRSGHIGLGQILDSSYDVSQVDAESKGLHQVLNVHWIESRLQPELSNWNIAVQIPSYGPIVASKAGYVFGWNLLSNSWRLITVLSQPVENVFAIDVSKVHPGMQAALISLTMRAAAKLLMWRHVDDSEPLQSIEWTLNLTSGTAITAAVYLENMESLVIGSRHGSVHFFYLSPISDSSTSLNSVYSLGPLHEMNAVTCILELGILPSNDAIFLTAGRDGVAQVFSYNGGSKDLRNGAFQKLHGVKTPAMTQLEGARLRRDELYLWGFRGKSFVFWNYTRDLKILEIECEGGNRSWSFDFQTVDRIEAHFVWTQKSKCYSRKQSYAPYHLLQPGLHGREVNCVSTSSGLLGIPLMATGSEDTHIRLSIPVPVQGVITAFQTACTIGNHLTGITHLQWSSDGHFLFSSGGEQLFMWRISKVPVIGIGASLISECPLITPTRQLRIMDFCVFQLDSDPAILCASPATFCIAVAYSNSSLRVWRIETSVDGSSSEYSFRLIAIGSYGSKCLTQIKTFYNGKNRFFLTSATDGRLAIWYLPILQTLCDQVVTLKVLESHAVHQSSIKSLDLHVYGYPYEVVLIVTGGDDNAVAVTVARANKNGQDPGFSLMTYIIPKAHAASVTAVKLADPSLSSGIIKSHNANLSHADQHTLPQPSSLNYSLFTASNDQMIKIWRIVLHTPDYEGNSDECAEVQIAREGKFKSDVADITSIDLLEDENRRIIVAGIGEEIWDLIVQM